MANEEHLRILRQGVAAPGISGEKNSPDIRPDLSGAELRPPGLGEVDKEEEVYIPFFILGVDFRGADLRGGDLRTWGRPPQSAARRGRSFAGGPPWGAGASRCGPQWGGPPARWTFVRAHLNKAYLNGVHLSGAKLSGGGPQRGAP